jgi:hypothetical protein
MTEEEKVKAAHVAVHQSEVGDLRDKAEAGE